MPLNRAPFNALVDDAGTGTTGTPWNKQAIKDVILDPVDALVGSWQTVPFNVANFWPGITAGHLIINYYTIINKTMFWMVQLAGGPAPSPVVTTLPMVIPAGGALYANQAVLTRCTWANDGGVVGAFVSAVPGFPTKVGVAKDNSANWNGPLYAYFTAVIGLA